MDYVTLSNGDPMPMVGFGVFQITDAKQCEKAVLDALDAGYRHIDTAQAYGNEEAVGNAIAASGIDKEEVFVTTKVWVSNAGYENALRSIEESKEEAQEAVHRHGPDPPAVRRLLRDLSCDGGTV